MDYLFERFELIYHPEFANKVTEYKENFDRKSFPYILPEVNYLGSYTTKEYGTVNTPIYVAIPIKNQGEVIFDILSSLVKTSNQNLIIGILLDNCTDNTKNEIFRFILEADSVYQNLIRIDLLSSQGELFEATCENILFSLCREDFFMSLQADIYFKDLTFMERALKAFSQEKSLLGLSGRAVVPFARNSRMAQGKMTRILCNLPNFLAPTKFQIRRLGPFPKRVGYFGDTSTYPASKMFFSRKELWTIFPGEAVIRGPLIWRAEFYRKLGGLNDIAYYLGRDDCDLAFRGNVELNTFVGFLPCESYSNPNSGTTRKPRADDVVREMKMREELSLRSAGALHKYWAEETLTFNSGIDRPISIN